MALTCWIWSLSHRNWYIYLLICSLKVGFPNQTWLLVHLAVYIWWLLIKRGQPLTGRLLTKLHLLTKHGLLLTEQPVCKLTMGAHERYAYCSLSNLVFTNRTRLFTHQRVCLLDETGQSADWTAHLVTECILNIYIAYILYKYYVLSHCQVRDGISMNLL